jgi:hypothetical protein
MKVNPINVINLLLATFSGLQIPESPVNKVEMDLAEKFKKILYSSMNDVNAIETIEEETLDFQEQFQNFEVQAIEDDPVFKEKDYDVCSHDDEELSFDYKKKQLNIGDQVKLTRKIVVYTVLNIDLN